nr:MAG TPA: hypothetical protein [Myoviridae sp. ctfuG5]
MSIDFISLHYLIESKRFSRLINLLPSPKEDNCDRMY